MRAVDGVDVNEPTEVTDRSVSIPAGGRADLEVRVPTDGSAVRVQMLGGVGLSIGPPGSESPSVKQPEEELDLLDYGSAGDVGFDTAQPDRKFDYSVGRRPGFLDGKPGLWWSVNGKLYPDMPMFVVREGDVVKVRISNHSGESHPMHLHGHHAARAGPRRQSRPAAARGGSTPSRCRTASPSTSPSSPTTPASGWTTATTSSTPREGLVTHLMYEGVTTPYKLGLGLRQRPGVTPE